ncbi:MAG: ribosome biogenesis GTPase Der [Bdellovibrionaceae bacterium]|nr:ribosome biogenesis GTPase Der [Pseudobdellovibrionaceae bacterium]|tara:strand:- start:11 stop:1378 length:1368 start_codon:yes stop_codon:yes gene_type:complete
MNSSLQLKKIVIIGRPNVGKSTLFNRLFGRKRALVHNLPGVTRDLLEEHAQWLVNGKFYEYALMDTGGIGGDILDEEIRKQVEFALSQADLVLWLMDSQTGVTPLDMEISTEVRKKGLSEKIPVFCIANKVDVENHESRMMDFFSLGVDRVFPISAEHGTGIVDLQEAIVDLFPEGLMKDDSSEEIETFKEFIPRIAIVGRPNVGKSTLINALLGQNRMITSQLAGTTIDSIDSEIELEGQKMILVDTAGIRRKSKTDRGVEVLSVVQTKKALERAHLAILVIDGKEGVTDQDEKIGGLIEDAGCSVILMVNKWDLQTKNPDFSKEDAAELVRKSMGYLNYAPLMFASALRHKGLKDLGGLISEILKQREVKIPTHEFSEWVRKETAIHNPKNAKFYFCHQSGRFPPTFTFHVNDPKKVHFSVRRHLSNAMRERWGYMGSPIRMNFRGDKKRATR